MISTSKIGVSASRGGGGVAVGGLVTDGLILNLDSTNASSYPGSGTSWDDLSGEGNDFTLVNGPTFSTDDGGTIVTDGANDYIQSDGQITETNAAMSAFAYVKCTDLTNSQYGGKWISNVFNKAPSNPALVRWMFRFYATTGNWSTYNYMSVDVRVGKNNSWVGLVDGWAQGTVPQVLENTWYYVGFTTDGTNSGDLNMYLNGVNVGTSTLTDDRAVDAQYIRAASDGWSNNFSMEGSNRNYHLYSRKLTDAEVLQNYNAIKL
jgi:hypothetical protein